MKNKLNAKGYNKVLYGFIGLVLCITIALSSILVISLNQTSREVSKNKYLSINNNAKIEALTKLEKNLEEMSSEETKLEEYLPDEKEVSKILKDWEITAQSKGLQWTIYKVGEGQSKNQKTDSTQTVKSGDSLALPYQVTLKGSFNAVNDMIRYIEQYNRLAEVKDVKFTKDTAIRGDFVEAVLQVNAYLKK